MAVQLIIEYTQLLALVEQLPAEQQTALLLHLLEKTRRPAASDDLKAVYHASISSEHLNPNLSIRREDWYGDDGR